MEDFDYPDDAPGKIVYRQIWRILRSREVPEDFFCEFFENLSLWEQFEDVPSSNPEEVSLDSGILGNVPSCSKTKVSDTPSHSKIEKQKLCAKALTNTLMYISATSEVYKREGMAEKLTRERENIRKNVTFGEEEKRKIEDEMLSLLNFFNFHKDRKCLYFIMMDIGARKVGSYFKEYIQLPICSSMEEGDKEEEILDAKCSVCLFHVSGIEAYCYTTNLRLKPSYVYLSRLNKNYEEAMKDITSRKCVSILFSMSSKTQSLSMMAITTLKTTYIIDFLATRIKYLPAEIRKILEKATIDKFVGNAVAFSEYIYLRHNVQISNLYDVQNEDLKVRRILNPRCSELSLSELLEKGAERLDNVKFKMETSLNLYDVQELDLEVRRQLNTEQLKCRKLSLSELLEKGAERLDSVKFKMEPDLLQKWQSRPVDKEVINATATASMYMYKILCCLRLTEIFLCYELNQHIDKTKEIMAGKP